MTQRLDVYRAPSPSSRAFHRPGLDKNRWPEGSTQFEISEAAYSCLMEISQVAHTYVNRAYPKEARQKNNKINFLHAEASDQIKEFRTRYKVIVRDDLCKLPGKLIKHRKEYDASQDRTTTEFRSAVLGQVFWLRQKLTSFMPGWISDEVEIEAFNKVIANVYKDQVSVLEETLSFYEAVPKEEVKANV